MTDPQQTHRDILSKVMGGETLPTPEPEPEPETEAAATTDWKSEVANLVHDLDGVTVEQAWGGVGCRVGDRGCGKQPGRGAAGVKPCQDWPVEN